MAGVLLRPVWPVARREEGASPQWGCDRRATKPQAKLGATQRAAVLFAPGFVAHSLQIHFGICSSLAPRLDRKTLAAKHQPFRRHNTSLCPKNRTSCPTAPRNLDLGSLPRRTGASSSRPKKTTHLLCR